MRRAIHEQREDAGVRREREVEELLAVGAHGEHGLVAQRAGGDGRDQFIAVHHQRGERRGLVAARGEREPPVAAARGPRGDDAMPRRVAGHGGQREGVALIESGGVEREFGVGVGFDDPVEQHAPRAGHAQRGQAGGECLRLVRLLHRQQEMPAERRPPAQFIAKTQQPLAALLVECGAGEQRRGTAPVRRGGGRQLHRERAQAGLPDVEFQRAFDFHAMTQRQRERREGGVKFRRARRDVQREREIARREPDESAAHRDIVAERRRIARLEARGGRRADGEPVLCGHGEEAAQFVRSGHRHARDLEISTGFRQRGPLRRVEPRGEAQRGLVAGLQAGGETHFHRGAGRGGSELSPIHGAAVGVGEGNDFLARRHREPHLEHPALSRHDGEVPREMHGIALERDLRVLGGVKDRRERLHFHPRRLCHRREIPLPGQPRRALLRLALHCERRRGDAAHAEVALRVNDETPGCAMHVRGLRKWQRQRLARRQRKLQFHAQRDLVAVPLRRQLHTDG